jgi:plasmid stabilization system protein ParE
MASGYAVTVSPEALVEILEIATWWNANRPAAPRLFQKELDFALLLIGENPRIGRRARSERVGNAHVIELRRSRYRVFYQVLPRSREVLVVHVRHARRRPLRP